MSNHYHLVVQTADVQLWRSMARIHGRVTREYNRRHQVFGSGWQCRYRARLVQDPNDLQNLLAYVHLNPVVAEIVDDPVEYELSGHRPILGVSAPVLVDTDVALRSFGDTKEEARRAYLDRVFFVAETKWVSKPMGRLPWWDSVSYDHQTVTEEDAPVEARTFDDRHPNLPTVGEESAQKLLDRAAPILGAQVGEITGSGTRKDIALARRRFSLIAAIHFNHSVQSISMAVKKSSSQVSRWLTRQTNEYYSDITEADWIDKATVRLLEQQYP